eukprot:GEMP01053707.1.p2 GENE.GEMP01053707.1~~GEMP01053707.1.p2  ORF type:complete len:106 (-),score=10.28 GEMP01053707.1:330-647(-)
MSLYIYKYMHVNDFFFIAVRRNISKDHVLRVPSSHPAFLLILRFRLSDAPQKVGLETKKYQPHGKKETIFLYGSRSTFAPVGQSEQKKKLRFLFLFAKPDVRLWL